MNIVQEISNTTCTIMHLHKYKVFLKYWKYSFHLIALLFSLISYVEGWGEGERRRKKKTEGERKEEGEISPSQLNDKLISNLI